MEKTMNVINKKLNFKETAFTIPFFFAQETLKQKFW